MSEGSGMLQKVVVPELGESVLEATVARWLKEEGQPVTAGEPLVELETEKVNLEVSAQRSGVLARILRQAGEDVRVGEALAEISAEAGQVLPEPKAQEARQEGAEPVAQKDGGRQEESQGEPARESPPAFQIEGTKVAVTPVAERLIREKEVDVSRLRGSGPGGRITREDVEAYLTARPEATPGQESPEERMAPQAQPQPLPSPPPAHPETLPSGPAAPPAADRRREERVKMSRRRRTIARRLVEAQQTAAMLTTFNEVDMSAVMDLRARRNEAFAQRHEIRLGITSFFVKAAIGALKVFPQLNAEIQGEEIVYKHYYDIGVAVGASEGLVVPVLRDADRLSFAEIERRIKDFAQRAENDSLTLEDLRGGTFTLTNGGVFGSLLSTPILNPPQVGILGLHKIEKRAVVVGEEIAIRPMMYVALSYDHRIVDGREAVQFLARVKELIEDPENILLEG